MDWAKSETTSDPAGSDQYELGSSDGRPFAELRAGSGGEPVRSILWFKGMSLKEEMKIDLYTVKRSLL